MTFLPITENLRIETDLLRLRFEQGPYPQFVMRRTETEVVVLYPPGFRFSPDRQLWLQRMFTEVLRAEAKRVLPGRLRRHAERTGLCPRRISIKQTRTRWGSCSSQQNINLSLYLMLLPSRFVDYVMLHELCHLREMNHGPRFWALLDSFTDGRARQLRREMRAYTEQLFLK